MEITTQQYKHCDLVWVSGRLDSATSPQLAAALQAITDTGRFKIVLDLSAVEFISSAGLRILIHAQKICKRYNRGQIILTNVPQNVYAALDLAGFTTLFKIMNDNLTAVGNI